MNAPCRHCTDRTATCHATCEKYKEFRAKCDGYYKKHLLSFEANSYIVTSCAKRKDARERRRRK